MNQVVMIVKADHQAIQTQILVHHPVQVQQAVHMKQKVLNQFQWIIIPQIIHLEIR